ncbi:hypothetical protein NPIL_204941 [Nephila pilipes]|uniref:Uncharacterized protein n=1 Tax=Nephila pilipes TaxID=299642 RepID=A0A8X6QZG6_NEPPI|nr:hypothetical protein NPIL_204941 [Nephila pilipes]
MSSPLSLLQEDPQMVCLAFKSPRMIVFLSMNTAHKNVLEEVQVAREFESSSAKIGFRRIQGGNLNKEKSYLQIFRKLAEEFTKDQERCPTDAVDEEEATRRTARKKTRTPKGKTLQKETSFSTVEKSEKRFLGRAPEGEREAMLRDGSRETIHRSL